MCLNNRRKDWSQLCALEWNYGRVGYKKGAQRVPSGDNRVITSGKDRHHRKAKHTP